MPKFFYIARDRLGKKITGAEEAGSQEEIINRLQGKELIVINVIPETGEGSMLKPMDIGSKSRITIKHNRVTAGDLTLFCRQLATLLGAGVTILRSLDIILQQVASKRLYQIIKDLEKNKKR